MIHRRVLLLALVSGVGVASAEQPACPLYKVNVSLLAVSKDAGGSPGKGGLFDGDITCVSRLQIVKGQTWGFIAYKLSADKARTPVDGWSSLQFLQGLTSAEAATLGGIAPPPLTVFAWPDGKAFFFKGSEYIRYDIKANRADEGYPKKIAGNWAGVWPDGIDAAFTFPDGKKAYFFKGSEYIRYDRETDHADEGYPQKLAANWIGVWPNGIDAAFALPNGKVLFFKGSQYISFDIKADRADAGYPRPIAGNWDGVWSQK